MADIGLGKVSKVLFDQMNHWTVHVQVNRYDLPFYVTFNTSKEADSYVQEVIHKVYMVWVTAPFPQFNLSEE